MAQNAFFYFFIFYFFFWGGGGGGGGEETNLDATIKYLQIYLDVDIWCGISLNVII